MMARSFTEPLFISRLYYILYLEVRSPKQFRDTPIYFYWNVIWEKLTFFVMHENNNVSFFTSVTTCFSIFFLIIAETLEDNNLNSSLAKKKSVLCCIPIVAFVLFRENLYILCVQYKDKKSSNFSLLHLPCMMNPFHAHNKFSLICVWQYL